MRTMFDLTQFIHRCQRIVAAPDPVPALRMALEEAVSAPDELAQALPRTEDEELLLHACGNVTLVLVHLTPNILFPPHNHHMPALIGLLSGVETNIMYVPSGNQLVRAATSSFCAPLVNVMLPEAIHAVANHGAERSLALHVYCGDLIGQARTIWNPHTFERYPYTDERYFALAEPLDPALPLRRPVTPAVHNRYLDRT